eukprot:scaffold68443_cov61-Phaeocystis_antarctica.AAC.5
MVAVRVRVRVRVRREAAWEAPCASRCSTRCIVFGWSVNAVAMLGERPAPRVPSAPMLQAADTAAGVAAAVAVTVAGAPSWQDMRNH